MKLGDGLFSRVRARRRRARIPTSPYDERIVDAACMHLVMRPETFDVLLLPNLYGDIVSDLCAGLVGGLGIVRGATSAIDVGVFEAVHGSAPDIAGKNIANPTALLRSARADASTTSARPRRPRRIDAALRASCWPTPERHARSRRDGDDDRVRGGDLPHARSCRREGLI